MEPRGPDFDDGELAILEYACETSRPSDYSAFLREWNGGLPRPDGLVVGTYVDSVRSLYSLRSTSPMTDLCQRRRALHGVVPDGYLAVGSTVSGALLIMDLRGAAPGAIRHMPLDSRNRRTLTLLAPTFSEFLDRLV